MSSALDVDYTSNHSENVNGSFSISILNLGLYLNNKIDYIDWSLGFRYANPSAFLKSLKTRGDYKPSYSDIQLLLTYQISSRSNLEILGIYADNQFDISPTNWNGNFGFSGRGDYRGISIESEGDRVYSYLNSLIGLKYKQQLN